MFYCTPKEAADALAKGETVQRGECIVWMGPSVGGGYGIVWLKGHSYTAHRLSYYAHTGEQFGQAHHICHRCDNPACINPDHLFLGMAQDNSNDRQRKMLYCNVQRFRDDGYTYKEAYEMLRGFKGMNKQVMQYLWEAAEQGKPETEVIYDEHAPF